MFRDFLSGVGKSCTCAGAWSEHYYETRLNFLLGSDDGSVQEVGIQPLPIRLRGERRVVAIY
jgi:hypothetical protein